MSRTSEIQRTKPAQLVFRFGAMGSAKSANAIMQVYNLRERGRKVLCVKPRLDTRTPEIWSRVGIRCECLSFQEMRDLLARSHNLDTIIVDECQFLEPKEVDFLAHVVDDYEISVYCYGLRTDFQANLFEGAQRLFALADAVEQIETVCWCGNHAIMNARIADGKIVRDGEQILCGADEYVSLCRKHFNQGLVEG